MPETLVPAVRVCPHCQQPLVCRLADEGAGVCIGAVQGYYTDAGILLHLCATHAGLWDTHTPTLPLGEHR